MVVKSVGKVYIDPDGRYALCRKCGAKLVRKAESKAFWIQMLHSFVRIHKFCKG